MVSAAGKKEKASGGRFSDKKGQSLRSELSPETQTAAELNRMAFFVRFRSPSCIVFGRITGDCEEYA
jgi:hypothetical protein